MDISIGIVTERQVAINRDGNNAERILQVVITDPRDVQSVQLVSQTGEESNPPSGSLIAIISESEGMKIGIAASDGILPDLEVGGKRIYSTDTSGTIRKADVRLDPDGKITAEGPVGSLTIDPDGQIALTNGAGSITISPAGVITFHGTAANFDCPVSASEFTAASIPYSTHIHDENDSGGPTDPPRAGGI